MPRGYELTGDDINFIYDSLKEYNITKEIIRQLIYKTSRVRRNKLFNPPSDCICLLLRGALYCFEEKEDINGETIKKVKCLISNNIYKFMFAPVDYCDENIDSKLKGCEVKEADIPSSRKIKASLDSIIIQIKISDLKKINCEKLIRDYYTNYSIQTKILIDILTSNDDTHKKKQTIFNTYPKICMDYKETIISNYFGIKHDTWKHN